MSNGALTNREQMNLMVKHMPCFMAQGVPAVPFVMEQTNPKTAAATVHLSS